ncbi:isocitrate lyase/phosphoenolpyruvate mutase family protein [Rhizobium ruizarguesonis]|uniref:isocitrate lyase/phosphoenolpyruvate mutase family protein n=1 Tax=Rhizobium ruizarguesonis TaxID=2081791 RepID=UPI00102FDD7D|nr:isocitrate lyase/phosphoenolpyruvate mutase family protein [Rhizobium ruizarguesonis]TBA92810.1 phosphoenolpyruvate phosphomutase [Rhizobium ruizarguesonis]
MPSQSHFDQNTTHSKISKPYALRRMLGLGSPLTAAAQLLGVHDVVSARLAETAGFDAVWASSLGLSIVAGRCDRDELSWMQLADAAEQINEGTSLPVVLDGNDGCGDINSARLFARRVARRGVAGLSIEDKKWPRKNSLAGNFDLLDPATFAAKLTSCRDATDVDDFVLVARTDGLIVGEAVSTVLKRAEIYASSGADAIIVHSKYPRIDEIEGFMADWDGRCPIIAIPTTYSDSPQSTFNKLGLAAVIWANQMMRASTEAMRITAGAILAGSMEARNPGGIDGVEQILALCNCGLCSPLRMRP